MSGLGNQYVSMQGQPPPPSYGVDPTLPYELQMAQIQRQQKLADLLRQQSDQPIEVQ